MSKKKRQGVKLCELKLNQVVWSDYFKTYIIFVERDYDGDYIFKYLQKAGYCCIMNSTDIFEPEGLIKELL
jgi:hypothetical protein